MCRINKVHITSARVRVVAALLAALTMLVPLAGCSKQSSATATLRLSGFMGDEGRSSIYKDVLAAFSADNPGIYLRDITTAPEDAYKLELNIESSYTKSDSPHIVFYYNNEDMKSLSDLFVSVQEIREDIPGFLSQTGDNAIEAAAWDDGKTYCIPIAAEWNAVAVHESMLTNFGLKLPENRDELLYAVDILSMNNIIPFANSAEDSALIIEAAVREEGGQRALEKGVTGGGTLDSSWNDALEFYRTLCLHNAFAPSALTDTLSRFVSPPTVYDSVLGADRDKTRQLSAVSLFEQGKAAMIALDRETFMSLSDREGVVLIYPPFGRPEAAGETMSGMTSGKAYGVPSGSSADSGAASGVSSSDTSAPGDLRAGASDSDVSGADVVTVPKPAEPSGADAVQEPEPVVDPGKICGGFAEGFYITRKAYTDPALRPLIVSLIERFAGADTGARMAALGYIPSGKQASTNIGALSEMTSAAAKGARYMPSLMTASNMSRYSYIQRCAVQMWYGLLTPEQMTELLREENRSAVDVLEDLQRQAEEKAAQYAASPSDVTSSADT